MAPWKSAPWTSGGPTEATSISEFACGTLSFSSTISSPTSSSPLTSASQSTNVASSRSAAVSVTTPFPGNGPTAPASAQSSSTAIQDPSDRPANASPPALFSIASSALGPSVFTSMSSAAFVTGTAARTVPTEPTPEPALCSTLVGLWSIFSSVAS